MRAISQESAISRIRKSGLTLAEAMNMEDLELLKLPYIGRSTLRFIRSFQVLET